MAGTSTLRDDFGNEIDPYGLKLPADDKTDAEKVIVDWSEIVSDDDPVEASESGSESEGDDDEESIGYTDNTPDGEDDDDGSDLEEPCSVVVYDKITRLDPKAGGEEEKSCICMDPADPYSALKLLKDIIDYQIDFNNGDCLMSNIVRSINCVFSSTKKIIDPKKIAAVDLFFRIRHELLFNLLCKSYNLDNKKSDMSFNLFGIESNRTPDMILDVNGLLAIIEVTATSSFERAAQSKGIQSAGFESKYQKEIDMLVDKGISCIYLPVVFNMSDTTGSFDSTQLSFFDKNFVKNRSYYTFMLSVSKSLAIISNETKKHMIVSASILFSNLIEIEMNHRSHSFLYTISPTKLPKSNLYKEVNVSPQVYSKVERSWPRFYSMLENCSFNDNTNFCFCLNTNTHRFNLEKDERGLSRVRHEEILDNKDKLEFFKNLTLIIGSVRMKSTDSESGVKFYEKQISKDPEQTKFQKIATFIDHEPLPYQNKFIDMCKYEELSRKSVDYNLISCHYDPDYEEKIIKSICNMDSSVDYEADEGHFTQCLGSIESSKIKVDDVFENARLSYVKSNSQVDTLPIKILKMKQPFILPIASIHQDDYSSISDKPIGLMNRLLEVLQNGNPFTLKIVENALNPNFVLYKKPKVASFSLRALIKKRSEVSNSINVLQRELYRKGGSVKVLRLSKTNDPYYSGRFSILQSEIRSLNREIKNRQKLEGVKNETSFLRLPTKGKGSTLRGLYEMEMTHFKDKRKQSTIEGVGIRTKLEDDYEFDKNVFNNICESLVMAHGENPDKLIDSSVTEDAQLLTDLKRMAIDSYSQLVNSVKNSCLGHAAALVSRVSHSLMYYSQLPFNSDYIRVDNLGYNNVLLIVRGGKKVFKSKSSKLFRLVYPIIESAVPWYTVGHQQQSSTILFNYKDRTYAITPWQMLHESILCESISFYPRVCSFVVLNSNPEVPLKQQFHRLSMNVILSFHNRRQTEVLLANLRYILLSTLGDFTGVMEIIPEFFGFNYDCFQAFVRGCVMFNYPVYFKQLNDLKGSQTSSLNGKDVGLGDFMRARIKNIFTGAPVNSTEDLALMIYSTFLMTKAPYQRSVERANNLKGILKIHSLYKDSVGDGLAPDEQLKKISVTLQDDYIDYAKRLFSNDFNIDPKYCALVGNFVDSIYRNQGDVEDLHSSWIRIVNKTWDELSTSTGLRGEYGDLESFWGKKGYFVVYKSLLSDEEFRRKADSILKSDAPSDKKRKLLKDINITYFEKISPQREFLIFHAVDKVQWRGGREIYVMDVITKTMQQPIEQFMSELCKKLDNELISIPSDRRSQVIHHSIFEKDMPMKNLLTWYLTLDCTKWAPKSVFVKFAITLLNMQCIPTSFKVHFLNYIEKLYNKRIYFNNKEVEVLKNNSKYTKICKDHLHFDESVNGYYLKMEYSWVMGIFNYTSSFLHAANQKYFSYILMKSSLISYKEESTMVMFAHSDDSGGRLTVSNKTMAKRALILYEINLKACNHLLSKKKSVVSRIYFEILSIIYLFKQLLALLPKFLGGLRFMPTDKGPAQDMLQSYSKCIEVIIAGANFNVAYMVMKFYSMLIWRFYYNRDINKSDYNRPVQYLGIPDAHPLLVLLCGSDAELLRLLKDEETLTNTMAFVQTMLSTTRDTGPIKPLTFEIKVRGIGKGFEDSINDYKDILNSWSIRNVNYHNSLMNSLSFLSKLNDSGFVGSLVNESTTRRLSRCYYMRSGDSCVTRLGNVKINRVVDSLNLIQGFSDPSGGVKMVLDEVLGEGGVDEIVKEIDGVRRKVSNQLLILKKTLQSPLKISRYLENLSLEGRKFALATRTLKPTVLQLVKTAKVFSTDFDPATLVSYIKEPEYNWAINDTRGLITAKNEVNDFCNDVGIPLDDMEPDDLLRICRTYGRENTKMIYLYSRVPSELRQIKSYSAFLTFLSVNTHDNKEIEGLTLKMSGRDAVRDYVETNIDPDIYLINNIISCLNVFINKLDRDFIMECTINDIVELRWDKGKFKDFINHIDNYFSDDIHYCILKPQIKFILHRIGQGPGGLDVIKDGAFYTFLKNQKVRGGWYGKGEILISIENNFYSFTLFNTEVESVQTNKVGKLPAHHSSFIRDVFNHVNLNYNSIIKTKKVNRLYKKMFFGYDSIGGLTVASDREIQAGVPCSITENRGGFLEETHLYNMKSMFKDHITIQNDVFEQEQVRKIYFLPIKKAEIIPIIKQMFDKNDFSEKMMREGLNDFEDFILTEIMTEYGVNNYIGFDEFLDGFNGSKIYEIFKKCREDNITQIPKSLCNSIVPAPQGSITRIFLDYTMKTGDRILETPRNLNQTIMRIRSEYPEQMTVILAENLIKCFDQMYTAGEQKEIMDSYSKLYDGSDISTVRGNMIKLLTFWGYGGLVNSIKKFTFTRDNRNYTYFNLNICDKVNIHHYEGLYPRIISSINKVLLDWESFFMQADFPYRFLFRRSYKMRDVINSYVINSCIGIYNYKSLDMHINVPTLVYYNMLSAFLKEDDFCAAVQSELSGNYILSTLLINYQNRKNILTLINNLKDCWCKFNKETLNLTYIDKLQRIPDNKRNYRQYVRLFGIQIPPSDVYYHGFLKTEILDDIKRSIEITKGKTIYRITSKVSPKSDLEVPANEVIKFKRPLRNSIFDEEMFEEVVCELEPYDKDIDTINEYWSEIINPYKPKVTKTMNVKGNKIVRAQVNWVVEPYISCVQSIMGYLRQVGENVILLTDTYYNNFVKNFPNSGVRMVFYKNKMMVAHYTFSEEFKKEVINEYIGGVEMNIGEDVNAELMVSRVRDRDGVVKHSTNLGSANIIEEANEGLEAIEKDGVTVLVKKEDEKVGEHNDGGSGSEVNLSKDEADYKAVVEGISKLSKIGLSEKSIEKLKDKYVRKALKNKVPVSVILSSLIREGELNLINEMIENSSLELSKEQHKSAFLSPEYFGMAYSLNRVNDPKSIKNPKVRAELESIHKSLPEGIGSCTLSISKQFMKTVNSNLKLWRNTIKGTKHKRENKTFLYTLILGLVSSAEVGEDTSDDQVWQDIVNKSSNYIAEDNDDEDDDDFFTNMFNFVSSTRLRYRPEGM